MKTLIEKKILQSIETEILTNVAQHCTILVIICLFYLFVDEGVTQIWPKKSEHNLVPINKHNYS